MKQELREREELVVEVDEFPVELEIHVSEEDITRGCRRSSSGCMVARAFQRLYPDDLVSTGRTDSFICFNPDEGSKVAIYTHSPEAVNAIREFDRGGAVEPFTFTARLKEVWDE